MLITLPDTEGSVYILIVLFFFFNLNLKQKPDNAQPMIVQDLGDDFIQAEGDEIDRIPHFWDANPPIAARAIIFLVISVKSRTVRVPLSCNVFALQCVCPCRKPVSEK